MSVRSPLEWSLDMSDIAARERIVVRSEELLVRDIPNIGHDGNRVEVTGMSLLLDRYA